MHDPLEKLADRIAEAGPAHPDTDAPARRLSVWELTTWVLPMAAEHFRRTLRDSPDLPQGTAPDGAGPGGTRWFTRDEVADLRRAFQARGRAGRYGPADTGRGPAPVITLTAPSGAAGRTVVARHLAVEAALAGWRVLLVTADEGAPPRTSPDAPYGPGLGARLAAVAAAALRARNAGLVDRGEAPVAMPAPLISALEDGGALRGPRPGGWPGLDVLDGAPPDLDPALAAWERLVPGWRASGALGAALAPWRQSYDLILVDPPRGLGPLAMACLAGADLGLVPVPLGGDPARLAAGLRGLGRALGAIGAEAEARAAALGQGAPQPHQATILSLPVVLQAQSALAAVAAGDLPVFPHLPPGTETGFHEIDYRALGRLTYAPLRDALHRLWEALAAQIVAREAFGEAGRGGDGRP